MTTWRRVTRRRFLKQTAATAGAAWAVPAIVPNSVLGAGRVAAPSNRITVGMIGLGRQAYHRNMRQFLEMGDTQIVAICEVDSWRMDNAKKAINSGYAKKVRSGTYKGCATYVDFRELLARKDIDAVMISTPDHWHTPMAIAAAEAGKDVSLEKPITRSIGEGQALVDAMKQHRRVFRVDSEFRSKRHFHLAAELVRNGRIGKVHTVTVGVPDSDVGCPPQPVMPVPKELDYERWQGPAPRAPYTQKRVHPPKSYGRPGWMRCLFYCDGMITNWGAHLNDVAAWCAGTERTGPVEVEGTGKYPPPDSFWNVMLTFETRFRFAGGIRWIYKADRPYIRVEGTDGWIEAAFGGGDKIEASSPGVLRSKLVPGEIHFPLLSDKQDFINAVKTRGKTLEDADVGHHVMSLCHLGNIAIRMGQKLEYDPLKERFIDNAAANQWIDKPIITPKHT